MNVAANFGLPLTSNGFANFSFEYKQSDPTDRSVQRSDAQGLADAGNRYIDDPNYPHTFHPNVMVWGAPEFEYDYKMFANLGLDLGRRARGLCVRKLRQAQGGRRVLFP